MLQADLFSMEKYAAGFVEACEQLGVDPAELVKAAQAVAKQGLTPEQRQFGRAYQPWVPERFDYGKEMDQARRWEMAHGTPARAGSFFRQGLGYSLFNTSGTGALNIPAARAIAGVTGSKPMQFLKGFFGGSDDERRAPAAAPAPAVNPEQERWKQDSIIPEQGGSFDDRLAQARAKYGGRYNDQLRAKMNRPYRQWYRNVPQAPQYIRRPSAEVPFGTDIPGFQR